MTRRSPLLRRLVAVSAVVLGVVPASLLVTGCSQVKLGSAAIVGSHRITIATLDTEVTNLSQAAKAYPSIVKLSPAQMTQQTLTWLVRFDINEQLAQREGLVISSTAAQAALAEIYAEAKSEAQSEGVSNVSLALIMTANGIPPNQAAELGRYQAIETAYVRQIDGGTLPSSSSGQQAAAARLEQAECTAAKTLNIEINPQFGRMDYSKYQVVPATATVSRPAGPAAAASVTGLVPAC